MWSGAYELYSWQEPNGGWSFNLLPSPSGVNIPAEVVFDQKFRLHGVNQLKEKISELPAGSRIFWMDNLTGTGPEAKRSEKLAIPPRKIIDKIRQHAQKHQIEVDVSGAFPPLPSPSSHHP